MLAEYGGFNAAIKKGAELESLPEAKVTEGVSIDDYSTWRAARFSAKRCGKTTFLYLSYSYRFIPYSSACPAPIQENRGGRERPPPKKSGGGHVAPIAAFWDMPLSGRPMGVALVLIYPCGKASEQPPGGGADGKSAVSLSLASHDSRSVLAVKGPLCRFAPWTAPGRSEGRAAVYEGKGGNLYTGK